ncbi:MAG TPA: aromatic-ring-hydroxylating dioxygenase subunit beta [Burkholderiales bacterium]|nr:aromatic-ring-hydroxylating dioxygenase subunit beta [Burkholderiales bacterium]
MGNGRLREDIAELNAAYARAIDDDRVEDWPGFFHERCLYKITTADNHRRGLELGLVYADSKGMLKDRVAALREANVYERQHYRHIVGLASLLGEENGEARVESPFLVVRIMRGGAMDLFAAGRYLDRVAADASGELKYRERIVVCDSARFDTLLAIPL